MKTCSREASRKLRHKLKDHKNICLSIVLGLLSQQNDHEIIETMILGQLIQLKNESLAKYGNHILGKQIVEIDQPYLKEIINKIKIIDELLDLMSSIDMPF